MKSTRQPSDAAASDSNMMNIKLPFSRSLSLNRIPWLLLGGALTMGVPSCGGKTDGNGDPGETTSSSGDGDSGDSGSTTTGDGDGDTTTSGSTTSTSGDGDVTSGDGDGDTSTGGDGDGDGDTSTGGDGDMPNPGVQTLGDACGSPGNLACAGENQKLQLLCDGSEWVANGTCSGTEVCDTGEANRGSCQEPIEGCVAKSPGETYCTDGQVYTCGPDLLNSTPGEVCESYCDGAEVGCSEDLECPASDVGVQFGCGSCEGIDSSHCATSSITQCSYLNLLGASGLNNAFVRLPSGDALCSIEALDESCVARAFVIGLPNSSYYRASLPEGWKAVASEYWQASFEDGEGAAACVDEPVEGCVEIVPTNPSPNVHVALVLTADETAPAANVHIESGKSCP